MLSTKSLTSKLKSSSCVCIFSVKVNFMVRSVDVTTKSCPIKLKLSAVTTVAMLTGRLPAAANMLELDLSRT